MCITCIDYLHDVHRVHHVYRGREGVQREITHLLYGAFEVSLQISSIVITNHPAELKLKLKTMQTTHDDNVVMRGAARARRRSGASRLPGERVRGLSWSRFAVTPHRGGSRLRC